MHSILEWGVSVILAIQTVRTPFLDTFFQAISNGASEYFYFAALPIICTLIHRTIGIRIAITILASVMINSLIKHWVAEPRPFLIDPSVTVISETGFGFPSGHTQQAALFFGLVIFYYRRWWVIAAGAVIVGLVGLSRIYLGVHYPTDVAGAICIAGVILFVHRQLVMSGTKIWNSTMRLPLFLFVLFLSILASVAVSAKDMISAAGLASGLVAGLLTTSVHIAPLAKALKERIETAVLTAAALLVVFLGLKFAFPRNGENYYEVFSFIRYFACGFVLNALPLHLVQLRKGAAPKQG
jgi:undecaprenyl-diphosphatase